MLKSKSGRSIKKPSDLQGHKKLEMAFENDNATSVKIGFPAANPETLKADEDTGATVLFKATVNNFGLGVPKRPFMSVSFSKNVGIYKKIIKDNIGKIPHSKILSQVGSFGAGHVKETIIAFKTPPNAPSTIAIKEDNSPLIDSGQMSKNATYALED